MKNSSLEPVRLGMAGHDLLFAFTEEATDRKRRQSLAAFAAALGPT